jgi:hypothetical protein
VKWSADEVAEVPDGVVTVRSTVAEPAGLVAVIEVAELTEKVVAALVPKSTTLAPSRFVPVMVTVVPPATGPEVGLTETTAGPAS